MFKVLERTQTSNLGYMSDSFSKWAFSSDKIKIEFTVYFKKLMDNIIELLTLLKREEELAEYEIKGFKKILDSLNIILGTKEIPKGSTSKLLRRLEDAYKYL